MSLLKKAIEHITKARTDFKEEIIKCRNALITLQEERRVTESLPIPRDEMIERVDALLEAHKSEYEEKLFALLQPLTRPEDPRGYVINPLGIDSHTAVYGCGIAPGHAVGVAKVTNYSLIGLLGDNIIRDALHASLERMPYPAEVGLPRAERQARLDQIDSEIRETHERLKMLRAEIKAAGIELSL